MRGTVLAVGQALVCFIFGFQVIVIGVVGVVNCLGLGWGSTPHRGLQRRGRSPPFERPHKRRITPTGDAGDRRSGARSQGRQASETKQRKGKRQSVPGKLRQGGVRDKKGPRPRDNRGGSRNWHFRRGATAPNFVIGATAPRPKNPVLDATFLFEDAIKEEKPRKGKQNDLDKGEDNFVIDAFNQVLDTRRILPKLADFDNGIDDEESFRAIDGDIGIVDVAISVEDDPDKDTETTLEADSQGVLEPVENPYKEDVVKENESNGIEEEEGDDEPFYATDRPTEEKEQSETDEEEEDIEGAEEIDLQEEQARGIENDEEDEVLNSLRNIGLVEDVIYSQAQENENATEEKEEKEKGDFIIIGLKKKKEETKKGKKGDGNISQNKDVKEGGQPKYNLPNNIRDVLEDFRFPSRFNEDKFPTVLPKDDADDKEEKDEKEDEEEEAIESITTDSPTTEAPNDTTEFSKDLFDSSLGNQFDDVENEIPNDVENEIPNDVENEIPDDVENEIPDDVSIDPAKLTVSNGEECVL